MNEIYQLEVEIHSHRIYFLGFEDCLSKFKYHAGNSLKKYKNPFVMVTYKEGLQILEKAKATIFDLEKSRELINNNKELVFMKLQNLKNIKKEAEILSNKLSA